MSALLGVSMRTQRRAVIGWAIGLAAVATMYAAFYPSIKESASQLEGYLENMPEAFRNLDRHGLHVAGGLPAGGAVRAARADPVPGVRGRGGRTCDRRGGRGSVAGSAVVDAADTDAGRARQGDRVVGRDGRAGGVPVRGRRGRRAAVRPDRSGARRGRRLRDDAAARPRVRLAGARGGVRDRPQGVGLRRDRGDRRRDLRAERARRRALRRWRGPARCRRSAGTSSPTRSRRDCIRPTWPCCWASRSCAWSSRW